MRRMALMGSILPSAVSQSHRLGRGSGTLLGVGQLPAVQERESRHDVKERGQETPGNADRTNHPDPAQRRIFRRNENCKTSNCC